MAFVIGAAAGFIGSHMRAIAEPGIICMAAISDTTCSDVVALSNINVRIPMQIGSDAHHAGLPFIYASSASVYGNAGTPLNEYAASKYRLDEHMGELNLGHWYGLRFFNVYGSGESHKGKQASIVSRLLSGDLTEVFEPQTTRDFVHVSDCVEVARWMLKTLPPSGIYDVGTGVSRSLHEVMEITGAKCALVPMPDSLKGKYQFHTRADLTKLRAAGYDRPFLSLEEGVQRMKDAARTS